MLLALLLFWLTLSSHFGFFFLTFATISIITIYFIYKKLFHSSLSFVSINSYYLVFIAKLFKEMILSSFAVIKFILVKPSAITQSFSWVNCNSKDDYSQVIYANCITLTPGTMSLELKDDQIMVHTISAKALEDLHINSLEQQILKLEKKK